MIFRIARHEFSYLFRLPLGWILLAITQLVTGLAYYILLHNYRKKLDFRISTDGVNYEIVALLFGLFVYLALFIVPVLCARSISNERRTGALRLLLSAPVSAWEITLGKLAGIMTFLCIPVAVMTIMITWLGTGAQLDPGVLFTSILGTLLLLLLYTAVSLYVSSLTSQPVLALVGSSVVLLCFLLLQLLANTRISWLDYLVNALSVVSRFQNFIVGKLQSGDLAYFLIVTVTFLVLTRLRIRYLRSVGE